MKSSWTLPLPLQMTDSFTSETEESVRGEEQENYNDIFWKCFLTPLRPNKNVAYGGLRCFLVLLYKRREKQHKDRKSERGRSDTCSTHGWTHSLYTGVKSLFFTLTQHLLYRHISQCVFGEGTVCGGPHCDKRTHYPHKDIVGIFSSHYVILAIGRVVPRCDPSLSRHKNLMQRWSGTNRLSVHVLKAETCTVRLYIQPHQRNRLRVCVLYKTLFTSESNNVICIRMWIH